MANKRANPFVEDYVQQRKVHVGLKQFNNNEDRLQKVYEKTLKLLFKGAKKSTTQEIPANTDKSSIKKDNMKQLCIGKDGSIYHSEVAIVNKFPEQHCVCNSEVVEMQCAYCDAALCSSCQYGCSRCLKTYCSHCYLVGSEGSEVCVSCYD